MSTNQHLESVLADVVKRLENAEGVIGELRDEVARLRRSANDAEDSIAETAAQHTPYPRRYILIRHGESEGNVNQDVYRTVPDNQVPLTARGHQQALDAGKELRNIVGDGHVAAYISPFLRTQQTWHGLRQSLNVDKLLWEVEEPRLREQEFGNLVDPEFTEKQKIAREKVGSFYFRFRDGESGADVYDRVGSFIYSMRHDTHNNPEKFPHDDTSVVMVVHGLTMRLFLMRYFRWTVKEFHQLRNPANCAILVLEKCEPDTTYFGRHYRLISPLVGAPPDQSHRTSVRLPSTVFGAARSRTPSPVRASTFCLDGDVESSSVYDDCEWIGFDLDHTVVRYNLRPLFELVHTCFVNDVSAKHPELAALLKNTPLDLGFARRGIVFDLKTGDMLSVDGNGNVAIAWHGRKQLTMDEIETTYGPHPHSWHHFHLLDADKRHDDYIVFTEFFGLGAVFGLMLCVEAIDNKMVPGFGSSYGALSKLLSEVFNGNFGWPNFATNTGGFFPAVKSHPEIYYQPRPQLRVLLERFREQGKRVFVCTNSHYDYSNFMMTLIAGKDWNKAFDVTFVFGQKPAWFHEFKETRELMYDKSTGLLSESEPVAAPSDVKLEGGHVYVGGSASLFHNCRVAYVGDHLVNDFHIAMQIGWTGVAVLEDDDACNSMMGVHFGPRLMHESSYWKKRLVESGARIVSDALTA